jgi:general secretion pathway protein K
MTTSHGAVQASSGSRGSALLAVLWLSAALSAIALTVATSVRTETERTHTEVDALRTYYLATGAIERALLYVQWGPQYRNPDGTSRYWTAPAPVIYLHFPSGEARVELIPESAKLSLNSALPEQLINLLLAMGVEPGRAQDIAAGIVDWRAPSPAGAFTQFDQFYLSRTPSFRSRHASFADVEELLLIRGVTPELFHGGFVRNADGALVPHTGLKDCLSPWGSTGSVNANMAPPEVLQAIGISPAAVAGILALRKNTPIKTMDQLAPFRDSGPGFSRLSLEPTSIATLRATARLRLSNGQMNDLQRSVSAMVKFLGPEYNPPYHVMRWYDNAYSPTK